MTGTTGVSPVGGGNTGRTGVPPVASNTFVYSYLPGTDLVFCYTCGGFSRTVAYEPYRDLVSAITNRFGSRVISTFEYANDAAGRRTAISRGGDAMGPLSDGDVTYTCDAAGNRMTRTENCETITYTLGVGDRLASYGRAGAPRAPQSAEGAYTHDAAGNVTRIKRDGRPTLDLAWNSQYQLVSVSTNGVFAEGYSYDALNRRVSTTTLEGMTRHVYDGNWQCIADIDENGSVVTSYVWGEGIDKLLAVTVGGSTYYALTDIQGTVWGYVDSQNNVVARWQYDAWGNVVDEYVAPSATALSLVRYRFQGREWSAATGLINFRMRWYDSETGRWLSKDPIGLHGGLNQYLFCYGDSINFIDDDGLSVSAIGISALAIAGAATAAYI
ncbi:MAG: RHS repeat-associated core domain-containing protein, partial [Kiritimatiellae bacterium]|nr:RHS repeat-associated core domain-containing protein [Kiritimatiellia bacterium]